MIETVHRRDLQNWQILIISCLVRPTTKISLFGLIASSKMVSLLIYVQNDTGLEIANKPGNLLVGFYVLIYTNLPLNPTLFEILT